MFSGLDSLQGGFREALGRGSQRVSREGLRAGNDARRGGFREGLAFDLDRSQGGKIREGR